jgi:tRNA threonylcarbamoyladenosine biosynthesis protein TsaE
MIDVVTNATEDTKQLAKEIGASLRGGEVFELVSDLGGGKTAFVKGLALGLGISEVVQSPTFTISRLYQARDGLELHHYDFYRLDQAGIMSAELAESFAQPNAIIAVEWGDIVHNILPKIRATVTITSLSDNARRLSFVLPRQYQHVQTALQQYNQKIA